MRPRVYVTRKVQQEGLDLLESVCDVNIWKEDTPVPRSVLLENVMKIEGLYVTVLDKIDKELLESSPELKVVSTYAVGYNNIDVSLCTEKGIPVGHTPGVLTETTADMAFALIMAAGRRVVEAATYVRAGKWESWKPDLMLGKDIHGSVLGIVGYGAIGRAVARRALGFNMNVLFYDPYVTKDDKLTDVMRTDLDDLLERSDYVSLHVPLMDSTYHLIGERELQLMKPSSVLVNAARGEIVDPAALATALKTDKLFAAALDVTEPEPIDPDDPLNHLPNCIIVPHIASASLATRTKMTVMAAQNLLAGLKGERLPYCVNPEVYSE